MAVDGVAIVGAVAGCWVWNCDLPVPFCVTEEDVEPLPLELSDCSPESMEPPLEGRVSRFVVIVFES